MPNNNPSEANADAAASTDGTPASPRLPRRKKMLSFEPNADFFVIDESLPPTRQRQRSHEGPRRRGDNEEVGTPVGVVGAPTPLMGPLLRRKKVVSMPLGVSNDFFYGDRRGEPITTAIDEVASTGEEGSLFNMAASE